MTPKEKLYEDHLIARNYRSYLCDMSPDYLTGVDLSKNDPKAVRKEANKHTIEEWKRVCKFIMGRAFDYCCHDRFPKELQTACDRYKLSIADERINMLKLTDEIKERLIKIVYPAAIDGNFVVKDFYLSGLTFAQIDKTSDIVNDITTHSLGNIIFYGYELEGGRFGYKLTLVDGSLRSASDGNDYVANAMETIVRLYRHPQLLKQLYNELQQAQIDVTNRSAEDTAKTRAMCDEAFEIFMWYARKFNAKLMENPC